MAEVGQLEPEIAQANRPFLTLTRVKVLPPTAENRNINEEKMVPHMNNAFKNAASAYRNVGVESKLAAGSGAELVSLLFDGMLERLKLAKHAMVAGDVGNKVVQMGKAIQILTEGLRTGLDLKAGGELAHNLDGLYHYCALRLTQANVRNDVAALDEVVDLLEPLAQAWREQSVGGGNAPSTGVKLSASGGGAVHGSQTYARRGGVQSLSLAGV